MTRRRRPAVLLMTALLVPASMAVAPPAHAELDLCGGAPDDSVRALLDSGRHKEVEAAARDCLEHLDRIRGPETLALAQTLDYLVESLWMDGRFDSTALALAERAIATRERLQGAGAGDLWRSLDNLGVMLRRLNEYERAEAVSKRALALTERAFGSEDWRVAVILNGLGNLYMRQGDYPAARKVHERALAIREKVFGPDDTTVSQSLHSLGTILLLSSEFPQARECLERALAIRQATLGPEHREVASTLNNLAILENLTGQYSKTVLHLERSAAIIEHALGPEHPELALILSNLAGARALTGDFGGARRDIDRAIAISEKREGPEHLNVAGHRLVLGQLLTSAGDFAEAERVLTLVVSSFEKIAGPEHVKTAEARLALADAYTSEGKLAESRSLLEAALARIEGALGANHYLAAAAARSLGRTLAALGQHARAKEMLGRSLAVRTAVAGAEHPEVAACLVDIAELERAGGDLASAQERLARALAIYERKVGRDHPDAGAAAVGLARVLADLGETEEALALAVRGEAIGRHQLRVACRGFSERQALRYAAARPIGLDLALEVAVRRGDAASATLAWDAGIRSRACVLDEIAARNSAARRAAGSGETEEMAATLEAYTAACERLASLTVRGLEDLSSEAYRALLDRTRLETDEAERTLAERSAAFRQARQEDSAGLEDVLAALPADVALVAYFRYDAGAGARYAAFVAPADAPGRRPRDLALVPLGDAAVIDGRIARWRTEIMRPAAAARHLEVLEAACGAAGAALREMVWDPVERRFGPAELVLVVPDGALHLVSFAALPAPDGRYLAEAAPPTHVLSAERDLMASDAAPAAGAGLLALGGPEFDAAAAGLELVALDTKPTLLRGAGSAPPADAPVPFRGALAECPDLAAHRFEPLPGAAREAEEIAAFWKSAARAGRDRGGALLATGDRATEAVFKRSASGRRVLHIATHGFFLGESCPRAAARVRGVAALAPRPSTSEGAPPAPARGDNPLRLSGLALAGANRRADRTFDGEDGILTAEEIGALDLSTVSWAVLSACETGVGDIQAGEGVLGLRRAFRVAGVRTLILSLWSVEDRATMEWMRALYQARFERGLGTARAVQDACRVFLARRREAGASTHPFYWAPFVAAGDWR